MSTKVDPERLASSSDQLGRLLREVNSSYADPADESRAWQRLQSHYSERGTGHARYFALALLPLAAVAAGVAFYWRGPFASDKWVLSADPAAVAVGTAPAHSATFGTGSGQPLAQLPVSSLPTAAPPPRVVDCATATKQGPVRDAVVCLERQIAGNSLEAERAIVELARLKKDQLRDPGGAVNLLRSYRQRFPDGALKGEVDFALIELLPQTGQASKAFAESDALLQTAWGRSRSSELRLLRGRLAQDHLGDLQRALEELSYVKDEFGAIGDEATLRTAECLERAGKRGEAIATYRAYLARKGAPRRDYAQQRAQMLQSAE